MRKGPRGNSLWLSAQLFRTERRVKKICTWWEAGDFRNVVMRGEQSGETVERNVRFGWGKIYI